MKKVVVQRQAAAARDGSVKYITSHQQGVDGFMFDQIGQPIKEPGLFFMFGATMETMAQVPVTGAETAHGNCVVAGD